MASALDAVLQLRNQEDQRQQQAASMAMQLQQMRQQAQQQAAAQQLAQLQMAQAQKQQEFTNKTSLADLGIKQAELGIKRNEADVNKKLMDTYFGNPSTDAKLQPSITNGKVSLKPEAKSALSLTDAQAQDVANRIQNGTALPSEFSKRQIAQVTNFLPKDFNIIEAENKNKAQQSVMSNIKVQDAKVNQANNLMKIFNSAYDSKTDTYNIPPAQHVELALGYAKMLSPTGVVAQDLANQLKQSTGREALAKVAIYFGADPEKVGGSTQSVLKFFRDAIDTQAKQAVAQRAQYQQGKVSDYIGVSGSGSSDIPKFDADKEARYQAWKAKQK